MDTSFQEGGDLMFNRKKQRLIAAIICGVVIFAMVLGLIASIA